MIEHCKGCGEELTSLKLEAVSRYGHGDICSACGVVEAINGDFITNKYSDPNSPHFPLDFIKDNNAAL